MRSTRRPVRAMEVARLMAVVVLPTPPFWLATATTLQLFAVGVVSVIQANICAVEHRAGDESTASRLGRQSTLRLMFHVEHSGPFHDDQELAA